MSDKKQFRILALTLLGVIILIGVSGIAGFLLMMRGNEITTVPDVAGFQLEDALISIQEKGLNTKIQLKYSSDPGDRGKILEQKPQPGSILRAGSYVTLDVSRGTIIDKIDDYRGWNIKDLRSHLMSIFATYGTVLNIKEPLVQIHDSSPEGTILQQKPEPGEPLTSFTELELVVSRGPGESMEEIPVFIGMDFQTAITKAASMNIPFTFVAKEAKANEKKGTVIAQTPEAKTQVPKGTMLQLTMTDPEPEGTKVFGILERTIPDYPVKMSLKYEIISPFGERTEIFTIKHKGGIISIPYFVEDGSTLVLSVDNRELVNFQVKK